MIGIYKITNPKGLVYVGQSTNIERRNVEYSKIKCIYQPKLYYSLKKYGWEQHQFEVIEECEINQLNERETFWGEHYGVLGPDGLSLRLGGQGGKMNQETKDKISKSQKGNKNHLGKFHSIQTRELMSIAKQGIKYSKERNYKISKSHSKPVLQYTLENDFIKEFSSIKEAKEYLNKQINDPGIVFCCKGVQKTAFGYIWKYKY